MDQGMHADTQPQPGANCTGRSWRPPQQAEVFPGSFTELPRALRGNDPTWSCSTLHFLQALQHCCLLIASTCTWTQPHSAEWLGLSQETQTLSSDVGTDLMLCLVLQERSEVALLGAWVWPHLHSTWPVVRWNLFSIFTFLALFFFCFFQTSFRTPLRPPPRSTLPLSVLQWTRTILQDITLRQTSVAEVQKCGCNLEQEGCAMMLWSKPDSTAVHFPSYRKDPSISSTWNKNWAHPGAQAWSLESA